MIIDQELCVGCGACANLCPEVFRMQEDGKAEVIKSNDKCDYEMAVDSCPVGAIKIVH
ncbi:hypothetical protein B6D52_03665 [Candidatus Parcubacteria bacterium 4484_255]|nr:MAG: hypothetical protein B6D52_03665 [Candidatus Parcubacteria bacterium 4484_255]